MSFVNHYRPLRCRGREIAVEGWLYLGARPWTFSIPLTMNDSEAVFEYACHEGNQGIRNILSAGRTAEKDKP